MAIQEGISTNKSPLFNGTNYTFWKVRMVTYLMSFIVYVWDTVVNGNENPPILVYTKEKIEFSFNSKAMNVIISGLSKSKCVKFMHCKTAKEMWDKLRENYEGDGKLKWPN